MHILMLSQYFAPEPADKFVDLARGLKDRGHTVQVLTGFPCYPHGRIYAGYRQSLYREESIDGNLVTRVPQIPDRSSSAIKRAAYYLSFAISAATIGLARVRPADVILVYQSAVPIGLAAWIISRVKRVPYVLDVVDLWPESVAASGILKNRVALWLIRRLARFIYHGARQVNVITEGYRRTLIEMGVAEDKIQVIYCWPAKGSSEPVQRDEQYARRERFCGRFNVLYAGMIGPCQHLDTVLDAARLLRDLPAVQFLIAGDGIERDRLVRRAKALGLDNLRFLGRRSPEEVAKMYALSDLLLVHLKPDPMSQVSIPSKTFSCMASGRPLLMAVEGEAAELVRKHGCGVAVPPSDPEQLAQAIRACYCRPHVEGRHMGEAGRRAYQEYYSSDVQISKVVDTLTNATVRVAA